MFMKSLKLQYESEIAKAKDNIEVYMSNPAGIGEHPDVMGAIDQELGAIAQNHEKIDIINHYFLNA